MVRYENSNIKVSREQLLEFLIVFTDINLFFATDIHKLHNISFCHLANLPFSFL